MLLAVLLHGQRKCQNQKGWVSVETQTKEAPEVDARSGGPRAPVGEWLPLPARHPRVSIPITERDTEPDVLGHLTAVTSCVLNPCPLNSFQKIWHPK